MVIFQVFHINEPINICIYIVIHQQGTAQYSSFRVMVDIPVFGFVGCRLAPSASAQDRIAIFFTCRGEFYGLWMFMVDISIYISIVYLQLMGFIVYGPTHTWGAPRPSDGVSCRRLAAGERHGECCRVDPVDDRCQGLGP